MTGYNPNTDNLSSSVTTGSNAGILLQPPLIKEITAVTTPTKDSTPSYTFKSSKAGTISYGGSCSSDNTSASATNNTVIFNTLSDGTYSNCTLYVTSSTGVKSKSLSVTSFTVDATAPSLSQATAVTTPTNSTTPSYAFSSNEAGTISYGGSCSSGTTTASSGTNSISFNTLSESTYSNCTITVTDSAGNASTALSVNTFVVDTTAPSLSQATAVTTPTNSTTPTYVFSSDEAGTITYGGSCSSSTSSASIGNNSITFNTLSEGNYVNCTIKVTDNASNISSLYSVNSFVIDTTAPTVSSVSSTNSDGYFGIGDNVTITVTANENLNVDNSSGNPRIQL